MLGPKIDPQAGLDQARTEELKRKLGLDQVRRNLTPGGTQEKKLREATEGFEAMFIQKLWQQMRKSVPKEGYLHSQEEDAYLSMFDEELSKKMASAGGIGLGDMLYRELQEQLSRTAGATAPRAGQPAELNPLHPEPMALDGGRDVRSLAESGRVKDLEEAGMRPHGMAAGTQGEAPASRPVADPGADPGADTRIEPDFDSLRGAVPGVAAQVQAPPEIMRRVQELAARIELDARRADGQAQAEAARQTRADEAAQSAEPGPLHWPVQGEVSSGFGWRTDKVTGARDWHAGVDVAGAEGDPVQSCWDGEVIFSGQRGRFGNLVVVEHPGGWRSYYGHNSVNLVRAGDRVQAGSKIAELGASGRTEEPHLHFEIRHGDLAENPADVMQRLQAGLSGAGANQVE